MSAPPMGNVEKPPSEKQLNYIRMLAKDMGWAMGEAEAFVSTTRTSQQASKAIELMRDKKDPRVNRPGGQEARDDAPAYGDDDIPADDDDPEPARPEMDDATRKAFRAELGKVGRWKEDVNSHIQAYIEGQGWGTPDRPGTTKYLDHEQRQAVLAHVAELPGPAWTDLFGEDALKPETPWYSLVKWFDALKLDSWDVAAYIMAEFGDNAPGAKKPADFSPELVKTIQDGVQGGAELVLDDIKDFAKKAKAV